MLKWSYFVLINVLAFGMMGLDKRKARKKRWRTPESTLFLVAAVGGGIGAWIGMYIFHHKTHKNKFVFGIPFLAAAGVYVFWVL